jgi:hypothetical protein
VVFIGLARDRTGDAADDRSDRRPNDRHDAAHDGPAKGTRSRTADLFAVTMALMGLDNLFAVNLRLGQGVTSDRSAARTCAADPIVTTVTAGGSSASAPAP